MEDLLETSPTGRAACHTCRGAIPKGSVRFGHAVPNPFSTSGNPKIDWHHVACAARTLPDKVRAALARYPADFPERASVEQLLGSAMVRPVAPEAAALPTADRAPTDRARCGQCFSPISKGTVRIGVEREVETESFKGTTTGWLHHGCAGPWAEANWPAGPEDFWDRVRANSSLTAADFAAPNSPPAPAAPKDDARVRKVARLLAEGKREGAAKELRLAASECPGWIWERVASGELAWDEAAVLDALGADSAAARPEALSATLARIVGGPALLPGLSATLFDLLGHVWRVQPEKLRANSGFLSVAARVGVALLGARDGLPVEEDAGTAAVELLALATSDPDCRDTDVTALAGELGVDEDALAERARAGVLAAERPSMLASLPVLVRLDLSSLCARLSRVAPGGVPGGLLVERRAARGEPAEAGLELLSALAGGTEPSARVVEEMALAVARRFPAPPAAIDSYVLGELPVDDWRPVLRLLPRERLESIRARVGSGSAPAAALTLDALQGGDPAREAVRSLASLAEQGRSPTLREASLVGLGGAAAIPALLEEHAARRSVLPADTKKAHPACRALAALRHALVVASGAARADGAPDDPELDAFLLPDAKVFAHEDCLSLFFSSDRRAFQASLATLPVPRRNAFAQAWRDSGLAGRTVETWLRWVMPEA